jgi:hypothetical protein
MINITQTYRQAIHTKACTNTTRRSAAFNGARFGVNLRPGCVAALLISFSVLVVAQRSAGQVFPAQGDDTTSSMGVFQITVDPSFRPLVAASGALAAYTGYNSSDGTLTSPLCIDNATTIGRSGPNSRFYLFPPVPIGLGSWDSISGYGDYPAIPFLWAAAAPPTEEVLTEIKSFILLSVSPGPDGKQCPPDPRIPQVPLMWPMVTAGTGAGVTPRSIGIVQENVANGATTPDFPAHSFFDIFVNVNLPPLPTTVSAAAFPGTGAVLYNDSPLIITNLNLGSFPPTVVYIHGETAAVPLKFKVSNPPYWSAGDTFGYVVLAGHGTITNDCNNTAAVNALLDAALGPIGSPAPKLPVEWLRTNTLCPSPGSTYDSVKGTNFGGQSIDVVKFTIPGAGTIQARNFSHGNLPNPITPPPINATAFYTAPASVVTVELSVDGQTWFPPTPASGPVNIKITNTTGTGSTSTFDTEMLQLDLSGNGPFGPFMLRESPTKQSLGRHSIRPDPRGYRISSFFDVFLELSTDGGNQWIPTDRSIRVQASSPPAAPNSLFVTHTNGSAVLNWLGSFPLQSSPTVNGTYKDVTGVTTGPFAPPPTVSQMYFRLRQ